MKKHIPLIVSIFALIISIGTYLFLANELENLSNRYINLNAKYNELKKEVFEDLKPEIGNLKNSLAELKSSDDKTRWDILKEDFYSTLENQTLFLTDFENYNFEANKKNITERDASDIAKVGFQRSAQYIAGEGAFEIDSQTIKTGKICANSYFTKYPLDGYELYKNIERECYIVTRENELGCGISVYVDKQTGLIIGGTAFGD